MRPQQFYQFKIQMELEFLLFSFNSTKSVTVRLSVGFSTANSFPFQVNDKVLIENVSVGVGSTGKGYNSKNYNYNLFTLTSVDSKFRWNRICKLQP
jgi:hypothetical protein